MCVIDSNAVNTMDAIIDMLNCRPESAGEKKSDFCYRAIRLMIVYFKLQPGAFIDKTELCRLLNVSRQPVTTALSRLEREGLVEILPQRGSYVSRLSLSGTIETMSIGAALEAYAVRKLAQNGNAQAVEALGELVERHERAVKNQDDLAVIQEYDVAFHRLIGQTTRFPKLVEQIEISLAALVRITRVIADHSWSAATVEQHGAIVKAIRSGMAEDAAGLVIAQIDGFLDRVKVLARSRPEIFVQ